MHIYQENFIEAFKNWDSGKMAEALIRIAETIANSELSEASKEDIIWSCREHLESVQMHPNISSLIDILGLNFSFQIRTGVEWAESPPNKHNSIKIELSLFSDDSIWKNKWQELGFENTNFIFPRDEVKTPYPLKDEPSYDLASIPSIHLPTLIKFQPNYSYLHALSVENTNNNEWLIRYQNGHHVQRREVWQEMMNLGEQIRQPEILPFAIAVVRETMRHCRKNIERLLNSLNAVDYPFDYPEEAFVPPPANVIERISEMEQKVGIMPLSICAWYELVGSVNFIADPESEWTEGYPDSIYVENFDYIFEYNEDNWNRHFYKLTISPDDYHKADVSGGTPSEISVPNLSVDALLENERQNVSFVDYMRIAFVSSGFPGGLGKEALEIWQKYKPELLLI